MSRWCFEGTISTTCPPTPPSLCSPFPVLPPSPPFRRLRARGSCGRRPLMDGKRRRRQGRAARYESEEVSSLEWEFIDMTEQEEDLIYRMYRLVGDRWSLIAGRVPGRKPEDIERFWIMRHSEVYAEKRKQRRS